MRKLKINLAQLRDEKRSIYSSDFYESMWKGKLSFSLKYSNKYAILLYDEEDRTLEVGDKLVFDWLGENKLDDIRYGEVISIKGNDVMILNQYGNHSKMSIDPKNSTFPNQKWYKLIYTTDSMFCDKKFPKTFLDVYKNKRSEISEVLVEDNGEFLNFKKV